MSKPIVQCKENPMKYLVKVIRLFSIVQKEIYKFVNPNLTKYINLKDIGYFLGQILHPNHIQYGIIT
jgi:hypothetical protein